MPTYGTCAYCGSWGDLAQRLFADAPPDACLPCSIVIVAERSPDLAVLYVGAESFVGLLTSAEVAALS